MKKPMIEVISKQLETVEDTVIELLKAPKDYQLHPLGETCSLVIDHCTKNVYLDTKDYLSSYIEEQKEYCKTHNEAFEVEVPDDMCYAKDVLFDNALFEGKELTFSEVVHGIMNLAGYQDDSLVNENEIHKAIHDMFSISDHLLSYHLEETEI